MDLIFLENEIHYLVFFIHLTRDVSFQLKFFSIYNNLDTFSKENSFQFEYDTRFSLFFNFSGGKSDTD